MTLNFSKDWITIATEIRLSAITAIIYFFELIEQISVVNFEPEATFLF